MPAITSSVNSSITEPATLKASNATPTADVASLFVADKATRDSAAQLFSAAVIKDGLSTLESTGFNHAVKKALTDKKSPASREAAAGAILAIVNAGAVKALEPTFIDSGLYAALLETFADKMPAVRQASIEAVKAFVSKMNPWAAALVVPALLNEIKRNGKWQVKTGAIAILNQLVQTAPVQTAKLMPDIVPVLAEAIWDTKADVKKAARESLTKATALVSNKDIERFIPALIKALINPVEEVPKTLDLLSATTFVSEVDSATLSLMVPLLSRGLNEKLTATKRRVAVITDNMAKLVDSAVTVRPFIPELLPGLIKVETSIGDPEARGVVGRAIATLRQIGEVPADSDGTNLTPIKTTEPVSLANGLVAVCKKQGVDPLPTVTDVSVVYVSRLAANLVNTKNFDVSEWDTLAGHLDSITSAPQGLTIAREWVVKSSSDDDDDIGVDDNEEGGEDLCHCEFSLAYGAKILLNTATLRLKRGNRYGLCGRNGTGKSTLMRAINNG